MHQPNHHPTPHHLHPEERIWAGRTPRRKPRVPDAPKIKHDKMKQFYMIDMEQKMWYYHLIKKCESLSLAKEKSLSQWEIKRYNERKWTLPKAGRHEGLKILFWRQSMGLPPPETLKISEMFVDSNDCRTFFLLCFLEALERWEESFLHRRCRMDAFTRTFPCGAIVKYFYIKQTAPKVARFDASYFGGSFTLCGGWAGRYRP